MACSSCGDNSGGCGCGPGAQLIGPCASSHANPCCTTTIQCGANEPLASIMQNFISLIIGQIVSTQVNGVCVWTLPCNLAGEIDGFPRNEGESTLCYLYRVVGEGAVGQNNTASNLGTGASLFAQKVGVDLQFKKLRSGLNIELSQNATNVTISFGYASVPTGPTDLGVAGQLAYDADFLYIAVGANAWRRVALGTW